MEAPLLDYPDEPHQRPELTLIQGGAETTENETIPDHPDWFAGPDSFRVQVVNDDEHTWRLNGDERGIVDWEIREGIGYIDSADSVEDVVIYKGSEVKVRQATRRLLAICMHNIHHIDTVVLPDEKFIF